MESVLFIPFSMNFSVSKNPSVHTVWWLLGHLRSLSRSMGVTYCWGVPRSMVFGLGEFGGEGMVGGRLRTRGFLAE